MQQITVTKEKKMTVIDRKMAMPYELVADGSVIAVVSEETPSIKALRTKCPNCKFEYDAVKPDQEPYFFTTKKVGE